MKMLFILISVLALPCYAQSYRSNQQIRPLVELGVGLVHASTPHYPGSDQSLNITLPVPALVYRGDIVRSDEDGGLRGRLLHSDQFEINLSFGGSLPVNSKDNRARIGMNPLDTIVQAGVGGIYHFYPKSSKKRLKISLGLPLRYAVSSDLRHFDTRGFVFNPSLYSFFDITQRLTLFTSISGTWASRQFHDYIYTVENEFAAISRPAYKAGSGFIQANYSLGLSYALDKYSFFAGVTFGDAYRNANKSSPLFIKSQNYSFAIGMVWWFYQK